MVDPQHLRAALAEAWLEALGSPATPDANFYALGGDSLSAMLIATRVGQTAPQVEDLDVHLMTEILNHGRYEAIEASLTDYLATA
jgi:hypothetical protein